MNMNKLLTSEHLEKILQETFSLSWEKKQENVQANLGMLFAVSRGSELR